MRSGIGYDLSAGSVAPAASRFPTATSPAVFRIVGVTSVIDTVQSST